MKIKMLAVTGTCLLFAVGAMGQSLTGLYYTSSPDSIGQGSTDLVTPDDRLSFLINPDGDTDHTFSFFVHNADSSIWWGMDAKAPDGAELVSGLYTEAVGWENTSLTNPKLGFGSYHGIDEQTTGTFLIQLTRDGSGTVISAAINLEVFQGGNQDLSQSVQFRFNSSMPLTAAPEPATTTILLFAGATALLNRKSFKRR